MSKHLTPKFADEGEHECQNCGEVWDAEILNDICDIAQRVAVGEPVPSGECPACGALCHPVQPKAKKAKAKKAKAALPSVLIAVSGGVVQGVRATCRVGVEVWDADNLEAEGMDSDARDKDWEERAKAFKVAVY